MSNKYSTQNSLLLNTLLQYYHKTNHLDTIIPIINGESTLSIRIIDWFVTNYAKKNYTVYPISEDGKSRRFKVYIDYKLKLKAYSKKRFDPFCRWDRITIPYKNGIHIQTTLGQLNFFKWALENKILEYIYEHFKEIENDMNHRNSSAKKRSQSNEQGGKQDKNKTRKKREELSISAVKSIKRENVEIVVSFD